MLRRRQVLFSPAWSAFIAPFRSAAQPISKPQRIGMLSGGGLQQNSNWDAFYSSMRSLGYVEGRDVVYKRKAAQGEPERLPQLARDLVATNPPLIVATGAGEVLAARQASVIPIVMIFGTDPVGTGVANSLAKPGGNVTGLTRSIPGFNEKSLELLAEALPSARRIGVLENSGSLSFAPYRTELDRAAAKLGSELLPPANATRPEELQPAFHKLERQRPHALFVHSDVLFFVQPAKVIQFAAQAQLPTMHGFTEDVEAGGLMAFAVEFRDLYVRAPVFIDKILRSPGISRSSSQRARACGST
jgi:putative tryptophan/tyrosine transport system substrate-binding protein